MTIDYGRLYIKNYISIQSEREQMGYLSQLEEVEECESTENELLAENVVGNDMEEMVINSINKVKT